MKMMIFVFLISTNVFAQKIAGTIEVVAKLHESCDQSKVLNRFASSQEVSADKAWRMHLDGVTHLSTTHVLNAVFKNYTIGKKTKQEQKLRLSAAKTSYNIKEGGHIQCVTYYQTGVETIHVKTGVVVDKGWVPGKLENNEDYEIVSKRISDALSR